MTLQLLKKHQITQENMFKKILISAFTFLLTANCLANDNDIVLKIGSNEISKQELMYYYNKNNANINSDTLTIEQYLDLFINFKLKVYAAYEMQLDTISSFKEELSGYRNQLIKPYLTDSAKFKELVNESYNHYLYDIEVSHIMFRVDDVKDTITAYNKALAAKKRLKKEKFTTVALDVSEDPSVEHNKGYLGRHTANYFIYSFEEAAYDAKKNKVVGPIRTAFGYHLIKLHRKEKSRGEVLTAHIFKHRKVENDSAYDANLEKEIYSIYTRLLNGEDFAQIAKKESEDINNAQQGGELPWLSTDKTNEIYEEAAFNIKKIGQFTKPIKAPYGWHIIKLLGKREIPSLNDLKPEIENRIRMDERSIIIANSYINKLKTEYDFKLINKNDVIAKFAEITLTQNDFDEFTKTYKGSDTLNAFINKSIIEFEKSNLENKYSDFKLLMHEYRDGILLFNISNLEVWQKAIKDTTGLREYFNKHKDSYTWAQPRFKGLIIQCKDSANLKQAKKIAETCSSDSLIYKLKKSLNANGKKNIKISRGLFEEGQNITVDNLIFETVSTTEDNNYPIAFTIGKLLKKPESYLDIRGIATSDYQTYLEKQWIKKLRKKYLVTINKEVLQTIK